LQYEQARVGILSFSYDANGTPQKYDTGGSDTYIGKLMAAYEVLGGNALYDLNIRSLAQAVYLLPAGEMLPPQLMSNGEVVGQVGLADASSAELMQQAREWLAEVLEYKRDYIERKIRRAVDYSDQLDAEITQLQTIAGGADVEGSLENLFKSVQDLFNDPLYRAIYDDKGKDPHGKLAYAPYKPYSDNVEGTREPSKTYGRDEGGATVPGQGKP
jgi:hypothetical protein